MANPRAQVLRYDALLIDPDMQRRMRLKSATMSVVQFSKLHLLSDIGEARSRVQNGPVVDVVFISSDLDSAEITTFVKAGKESKYGQDAAYILVLKTSSQDSTTVAQNVLIGADGFLFEPYSVDQLVEITELAAKVKKERSRTREVAAMSMMLTDVMSQLDMMAYLKSAGYDVAGGQRKFAKMCSFFSSLSEDSRALYYEQVVQRFIDAPLPQKVFQSNYKGASSRVKKKMEEKLLAEQEKDLEY